MTRVTYRVREYLPDFKARDHYETVVIYRAWEHGNLLYGYRDRFNTVCISKEDIVKIEEVTA